MAWFATFLNFSLDKARSERDMAEAFVSDLSFPQNLWETLWRKLWKVPETVKSGPFLYLGFPCLIFAKA
jgi:hypothetical protein